MENVEGGLEPEMEAKPPNFPYASYMFTQSPLSLSLFFSFFPYTVLRRAL
jgi:hypothetical protein